MNQAALDFTAPLPAQIAPPKAPFDGSDYDPERDDVRLQGQQLRIWSLMRDGAWRGLADIAARTGDPEASISAQLRHLRKPRFGGFVVEKRHEGGGLYAYRVLAPASLNAQQIG